MTFTYLSPLLTTQDFEETIEFYTKTLGFKCQKYDKYNEWASLRRDNVTIMFSAPTTRQAFEKPVLTGSLYIYSEDVDAEWAKIKEKVSICYPLKNFDYGMREFAFYDNNGYLLRYGQIKK